MNCKNNLSIDQVCNNINQEFKTLSDKKQVFNYLISLSKKGFDLSTTSTHDDKFLVKGCISKAWLVPSYNQGKIHFSCDSEAHIVKSILILLMRVYNHRTPQQILSVGVDYWKDLGFTSILSMNRRNGIAHMLKQIYLYAATYQALEQKPSSNTQNLNN